MAQCPKCGGGMTPLPKTATPDHVPGSIRRKQCKRCGPQAEPLALSVQLIGREAIGTVRTAKLDGEVVVIDSLTTRWEKL